MKSARPISSSGHPQSPANPPELLWRGRIIDRISACQRDNLPIVIEAQAGQGKSTLAAQYLAHTGKPFFWFQFSDDDRDPVSFLYHLYDEMVRTLPGFRSELLAVVVDRNEVDLTDLFPLFKQLISDLSGYFNGDHYVVLDDLHHISGCAQTCCLVATLFKKEQTALKCRLMVLSRHAIEKTLAISKNCLRLTIDNGEMALSKTEVAEYLNLIEITANSQTVDLLHRMTEGWIMGLALATQSLRFDAEGLFRQPLSSKSMKSCGVFIYLLTEVLDHFSPKLVKTLCKLALLPEINLELAGLLGNGQETIGSLQELVANNFFIRYASFDHTKLAIHRLFRDCLKESARAELTEKEYADTFLSAAKWYLQEDRPEMALKCYLDGEFYQEAERILRQVGLRLFADNRIITLQNALLQIPPAIIQASAWLSFFSGAVCMNSDPKAAVEYFAEARAKFAAGGDQIGEFVVLTHIIFYNVLGDACSSQNNPFFERAVTLFPQIRRKLDIYYEIQGIIALAQGYCWFKVDLAQADKYLLEALHLARMHDLENFIAVIHFTRSYCFAFGGRWEAALNEIGCGMNLIKSPRVNALNKNALNFMQADILEAAGEFENFERFKSALEKENRTNLMLKCAFGPFITLRHIDCLIALGKYTQAYTVIKAALADQTIQKSPHLHSQFLQYSALSAALSGNAPEALESASRSITLRDQIGMTQFIIYNRLIVGAAYAFLGRKHESEKLLEEALSISLRMGEEALRAGIHAYRAYLKIAERQPGHALMDIRTVLSLLKKNNYKHFFGCTRPLMTAVLSTAVGHGIEIPFARQFAAERLNIAFDSDANVLPLLNIELLGRFRISLGDRVVLNAGDLTPKQRQLIALLMTSPGYRLGTDQIRLSLWPDSSAKKSRSNMDTLLSRMRTVLTAAFGGYAVHLYFNVNNGELRMDRCRSDAAQFVDAARKGLKHANRGESWKADYAFYIAHRLWQGEFMSGLQMEGALSKYQTDILSLYIESAAAWSSLLRNRGQVDEALTVAAKALNHDDINENLVRIVFDLYADLKKPAKTIEVLKNYRNALRRADFEPNEIEAILESFWSN